MKTRLRVDVAAHDRPQVHRALSSSLVLITAASIAVIVVRSEPARGRATLAVLATTVPLAALAVGLTVLLTRRITALAHEAPPR